MKNRNYFVYITTNPNKNALYVGVTNSLEQRLIEHYLNRGNSASFAGKYYCYNLVFYERHTYINNAIAREKQIKRWGREKKMNLITIENPKLDFLNHSIMEWKPNDDWTSRFAKTRSLHFGRDDISVNTMHPTPTCPSDRSGGNQQNMN